MSFLNRFLEFPPQDDTLHSVIRNLSYLLNSRPGYGSRLREYGVGDYLAQPRKEGRAAYDSARDPRRHRGDGAALPAA